MKEWKNIVYLAAKCKILLKIYNNRSGGKTAAFRREFAHRFFGGTASQIVSLSADGGDFAILLTMWGVVSTLKIAYNNSAQKKAK